MKLTARDGLLFLFGLVTLAVGAVVALVYAGGNEQQIIARVGLITTIVGPLVALGTAVVLRQADQAGRIDNAEDRTDVLANELEASHARIAYLEERLRNAPPVQMSGAPITLLPPPNPPSDT
jgi:hypothetical protein